MAEVDPTEEPSQRWLRWANEDLVAARHSAADAEIAPRVACGLAQQDYLLDRLYSQAL